ncbi:MAG: glycosyl transferase family 90 [Alphaproteobacteria bacterium]
MEAREDAADDAIGRLRELVRRFPYNPEHRLRLGYALRQVDDLAAAAAVHGELATLAPHWPAARWAAGSSAVMLALATDDPALLAQGWRRTVGEGTGWRIGVGRGPQLPASVVRIAAADGRLNIWFGPEAGGVTDKRAEITALRLLGYWPMLRDVLAALDRPVTVLLDLNDGNDPMPALPRLAFCGNGDHVFLVPDPDYARAGGYSDLRAQIAATPVPWETRRRAALWRGAANGMIPPGGDWRAMQRIRLCRLAADDPAGRIDAGLHRLPQAFQYDAATRADMKAFIRPQVAPEDYRRWRWQIDVDGHTNAWSGFFQRLLSGSPVLKVASPGGYRQWFYDRLRPWTNVAPVAVDLGDLTAVIERLDRDDDLARRIGEAGAALAHALGWKATVRDAAQAFDRADRALRAAGG